MVAGSLVVSHISSQAATWSAMIALLAVHLGMNYLAVRAVSMRTLNRQRANLVFSSIYEKRPFIGGSKEVQSVPQFPPPDEISLQERVFERDGVLRWRGDKILGYCQIGVPLRKVLNLLGSSISIASSYTGADSDNAATLLALFQDEGYVLWYDEPRKTFLICLKLSSDTETQVYAWMHALFIAIRSQNREETESVQDIISSSKRDFKSWMESHSIIENLKKIGWDLNTAALETQSGTRFCIKAEE